MTMSFETTCYASYKPDAWDAPCAGAVSYHRRSDMYLCEAHRAEYDAMMRR